MLSTQTAGLDQPVVSIQADWACVWLRVEGPIDENSIPLVIQEARARSSIGTRRWPRRGFPNRRARLACAT